MEEKPRIVITRSRRPEPAATDFAFTSDMLPADGALKDYRRMPGRPIPGWRCPSVTEEAWRRTDLHLLPADTFRLPAAGAFRDLAPVPADLLKPLTADRHGGQVILLPGGSALSLDPELVRQNVHFSPTCAPPHAGKPRAGQPHGG